MTIESNLLAYPANLPYDFCPFDVTYDWRTQGA